MSNLSPLVLRTHLLQETGATSPVQPSSVQTSTSPYCPTTTVLSLLLAVPTSSTNLTSSVPRFPCLTFLVVLHHWSPTLSLPGQKDSVELHEGP